MHMAVRAYIATESSIGRLNMTSRGDCRMVRTYLAMVESRNIVRAIVKALECRLSFCVEETDASSMHKWRVVGICLDFLCLVLRRMLKGGLITGDWTSQLSPRSAGLFSPGCSADCTRKLMLKLVDVIFGRIRRGGARRALRRTMSPASRDFPSQLRAVATPYSVDTELNP